MTTKGPDDPTGDGPPSLSIVDHSEILENVTPPGTGGRLSLRVRTDITAMNWRRFKTAFDSYLATGCTHIRLYLADAKFIDSAGVSLLTLLNGSLMARDGGLRLSGVPDVVRAVLQSTRIDRLISVDPPGPGSRPA